MLQNFINKIHILSNKVINLYKDLKNKITFLEENNMSIAYNFFETGEIYDCVMRLKIMNILWPENECAKYLLGICYMLIRRCDKALIVFNEIKNYNNNIVSIFIDLSKKNKTKDVIDFYNKNNFNLLALEDEIKKIYI